MEVNFEPTTAPYGDFLISRFPSKRLSFKLLSLGFEVTKVAGVQIYTRGFGTPHEIINGRALLSGLANIDGALASGPSLVTSTTENFIGMGAIIRRIKEGIEVRGDFMGLGAIFHSESYVSNRTHLMAIALECRGHLRGNISAIASNFWMDNAFCGQISTFETVIDGVEIAPVGSRCIVSEHAIELNVPQPQISALCPEEYQALIRRGAEEVLDNVNAAVENSAYEVIRLGITGGRDSRAILAALVRNGQVGKVRFTTNERGLDVPIATGLVKYFGGEYGAPGEIIGYQVSDSEMPLNRRRSGYFGIYNDPRFGMFSHIRPIRESKELELAGGCGEVYRHFYHKNPFSTSNLSSTYNRIRFLTDEIESKGHWYKLFGQNIGIPFANTLTDTFDRLPGLTLSEKLNAHYQQFRNSMHFGLVASCMSSNKTAWHPLASPSLLRAANGLPQEVRGTGRVVFDLTKELCPELAYFNYTFGRPKFYQVPFHSPHSYDDTPPESPPAAPEIRLQGKKVSSTPIPSAKPFNAAEYVRKCLPSLLKSLEETDLAFLSTAAARSKLDWLSRTGREQALNRWFTKYEWAVMLAT